LPYIKSKDKAKIYYEILGDEKSYPIILIHPIGGNIEIWDHEISFILKKGFRIIAYFTMYDLDKQEVDTHFDIFVSLNYKITPNKVINKMT
jgi:hypothetical protein